MRCEPKFLAWLLLLGLALPLLAAASLQVKGAPLHTPTFAIWRDDPRPLYRSKAPPGGPSYPDTVDLSCGVLEHGPDDSLSAPNNFGDSCEFQRIYTTALAVAGKHEEGMTVGWRHIYSITGSVATPGSWSPVRFEDPKGAVEEWIPTLKDGKPTGEFPFHPGAPFILQGVPSSTTGNWNSLTWRMNGLAKWVYLPVGGAKANTYKLSQVFGPNGTAITFKYDPDHRNRLKEILDNSGKLMLGFEYGIDGLMTSATNSVGISVYYSYSTQAGCPCLTIVSPLSQNGEAKNKVFWKYGYQAIRKQPFLATVETPVQSETQLSLHRNVFDPETGKETTFVDANGGRAEFTYLDGGKTNVQIFGPGG